MQTTPYKCIIKLEGSLRLKPKSMLNATKCPKACKTIFINFQVSFKLVHAKDLDVFVNFHFETSQK